MKTESDEESGATFYFITPELIFSHSYREFTIIPTIQINVDHLGWIYISLQFAFFNLTIKVN